MQVKSTPIPGLLVIEPEVFHDSRGFLVEAFQSKRFHEASIHHSFVQDNHSQSKYGTIRGLHYQIEFPQGKLCSVVRGEIFDVAVDLRRKSPTWGCWYGVHLSESNHRQIFIPPGFAHGFAVLSEVADVLYKCTDYHSPDHERTLLWNDPHLNIEWPIDAPILSEKDKSGQFLSDASSYENLSE